MKAFVFFICLVSVHLRSVHLVAITTQNGETSLHFDFKTENGQQREEDVKYDNKNVVKGLNQTIPVMETPVEIRGGYSFISADGYEYIVKYKANKNGFQPYVTARKLTNPPAVA